jgi:hypothetical protein
LFKCHRAKGGARNAEEGERCLQYELVEGSGSGGDPIGVHHPKKIIEAGYATSAQQQGGHLDGHEIVGKEFEERLMLQDAFHGESGDCIRITADGSTENAGSTGMYGDGKVGKGGSGGSG